MDLSAAPKARRTTRSSLACLPCRSRHMKCDGKRPCCARCSQAGIPCSYARSRRGGLDRAALTDRRNRVASAASTEVLDYAIVQSNAVKPYCHERATAQDPGTEITLDLGDLDTDYNATLQGSGPQVETGRLTETIENDPLINAYYNNFHVCHPFVVPRARLAGLYQNPNKQDDLTPLIAALRLIGKICTAQGWPIALKEDLETSLSTISPYNPMQVQCRILYSVALFWHDHEAEAMLQMDQAVKVAISLRMFQSQFAKSQGTDDPIQLESWRRTWWTLYILDLYYAGTLGSKDLRIVGLDLTVELPCEESEYQSGVSLLPNALFVGNKIAHT